MCALHAPLLGTWRGPGKGSYPTIDDFDYLEELSFSHVGKPFIVMGQRSRDPLTSEPLHAEAGYLRAVGQGQLEFVVAQPSGIVEVSSGSVAASADGLVIELQTLSVGCTPEAKQVTSVKRRMQLQDDTLVSELWMAAVGESELIHHVRSELRRC